MTIATFDVATTLAVIAAITTGVQFVKKGLEWLKEHTSEFHWAKAVWTWWAHGKGPIILAAFGSVLAILPDIAADGKLTVPELADIAKAAGLWAGSNVMYWVLRTAAFTKGVKKKLPWSKAER